MSQSTQNMSAAPAAHFTTDTMHGLQALYIQDLRELYSAESQIIQALPVMMASATRPELQQGFKMHLEQTQQQASRLEKIFASLGESPYGMMCKGIFALLGEGQMLIKMKAPGAVLDAGLIAAAQHVEHYEIASYGTVATWAKLLGRNDDMKLLLESLEEEKETDKKLTQLAEGLVNAGAARA